MALDKKNSPCDKNVEDHGVNSFPIFKSSTSEIQKIDNHSISGESPNSNIHAQNQSVPEISENIYPVSKFNSIDLYINDGDISSDSDDGDIPWYNIGKVRVIDSEFTSKSSEKFTQILFNPVKIQNNGIGFSKKSQDSLIYSIYRANQNLASKSHREFSNDLLVNNNNIVPRAFSQPSDWWFWDAQIDKHNKMLPFLLNWISDRSNQLQKKKMSLLTRYKELYLKWNEYLASFDKNKEVLLKEYYQKNSPDVQKRRNGNSRASPSAASVVSFHKGPATSDLKILSKDEKSSHSKELGLIDLWETELEDVRYSSKLKSGWCSKGADNFTSDAVRSDAELLEIIQKLQYDEVRNPESRSQRTAAKIPGMILDPNERLTFKLKVSNRVIEDPIEYYNTKPEPSVKLSSKLTKAGWANDGNMVLTGSVMNNNSDKDHIWTADECSTFIREYLRYPKKFGQISEALTFKSFNDCVLFYYRNKKPLELKSLLARHKRKNRKGRKSSSSLSAENVKKKKEKVLVSTFELDSNLAEFDQSSQNLISIGTHRPQVGESKSNSNNSVAFKNSDISSIKFEGTNSLPHPESKTESSTGVENSITQNEDPQFFSEKSCIIEDLKKSTETSLNRNDSGDSSLPSDSHIPVFSKKSPIKDLSGNLRFNPEKGKSLLKSIVEANKQQKLLHKHKKSSSFAKKVDNALKVAKIRGTSSRKLFTPNPNSGIKGKSLTVSKYSNDPSINQRSESTLSRVQSFKPKIDPLLNFYSISKSGSIKKPILTHFHSNFQKNENLEDSQVSLDYTNSNDQGIVKYVSDNSVLFPNDVNIQSKTSIDISQKRKSISFERRNSVTFELTSDTSIAEPLPEFLDYDDVSNSDFRTEDHSSSDNEDLNEDYYDNYVYFGPQNSVNSKVKFLPERITSNALPLGESLLIIRGLKSDPTIARLSFQSIIDPVRDSGRDQDVKLGAVVWNYKERIKVLDGFRRFGRNFAEICRVIKTKSEAQCRYFYYHYRLPGGTMLSEIFDVGLVPFTPSSVSAISAGPIITPANPEKVLDVSSKLYLNLPVKSIQSTKKVSVGALAVPQSSNANVQQMDGSEIYHTPSSATSLILPSKPYVQKNNSVCSSVIQPNLNSHKRVKSLGSYSMSSSEVTSNKMDFLSKEGINKSNSFRTSHPSTAGDVYSEKNQKYSEEKSLNQRMLKSRRSSHTGYCSLNSAEKFDDLNKVDSCPPLNVSNLMIGKNIEIELNTDVEEVNYVDCSGSDPDSEIMDKILESSILDALNEDSNPSKLATPPIVTASSPTSPEKSLEVCDNISGEPPLLPKPKALDLKLDFVRKELQYSNSNDAPKSVNSNPKTPYNSLHIPFDKPPHNSSPDNNKVSENPQNIELSPKIINSQPGISLSATSINKNDIKPENSPVSTRTIPDNGPQLSEPQKSETQTSDLQTSEPQKLELQKSGLQQPDPQKPIPQKSEIQKSDAQDSNIQKSSTLKSEIQKSDPKLISLNDDSFSKSSANSLDEKSFRKPSYSSYWSVQERNSFLNHLAAIGTNWSEMATAIGSKTATQVRNYFRTHREKLGFDVIVKEFEDRKAAGLPLLIPTPNSTKKTKSVENLPEKRGRKKKSSSLLKSVNDTLPKQLPGSNFQPIKRPGLDIHNGRISGELSLKMDNKLGAYSVSQDIDEAHISNPSSTMPSLAVSGGHAFVYNQPHRTHSSLSSNKSSISYETKYSSNVVGYENLSNASPSNMGYIETLSNPISDQQNNPNDSVRSSNTNLNLDQVAQLAVSRLYSSQNNSSFQKNPNISPNLDQSPRSAADFHNNRNGVSYPSNPITLDPYSANSGKPSTPSENSYYHKAKRHRSDSSHYTEPYHLKADMRNAEVTNEINSDYAGELSELPSSQPTPPPLESLPPFLRSPSDSEYYHKNDEYSGHSLDRRSVTNIRSLLNQPESSSSFVSNVRNAPYNHEYNPNNGDRNTSHVYSGLKANRRKSNTPLANNKFSTASPVESINSSSRFSDTIGQYASPSNNNHTDYHNGSKQRNSSITNTRFFNGLDSLVEAATLESRNFETPNYNGPSSSAAAAATYDFSPIARNVYTDTVGNDKTSMDTHPTNSRISFHSHLNSITPEMPKSSSIAPKSINATLENKPLAQSYSPIQNHGSNHSPYNQIVSDNQLNSSRPSSSSIILQERTNLNQIQPKDSGFSNTFSESVKLQKPSLMLSNPQITNLNTEDREPGMFQDSIYATINPKSSKNISNSPSKTKKNSPPSTKSIPLPKISSKTIKKPLKFIHNQPMNIPISQKQNVKKISSQKFNPSTNYTNQNLIQPRVPNNETLIASDNNLRDSVSSSNSNPNNNAYMPPNQIHPANNGYNYEVQTNNNLPSSNFRDLPYKKEGYYYNTNSEINKSNHYKPDPNSYRYIQNNSSYNIISKDEITQNDQANGSVINNREPSVSNEFKHQNVGSSNDYISQSSFYNPYNRASSEHNTANHNNSYNNPSLSYGDNQNKQNVPLSYKNNIESVESVSIAPPESKNSSSMTPNSGNQQLNNNQNGNPYYERPPDRNYNSSGFARDFNENQRAVTIQNPPNSNPHHLQYQYQYRDENNMKRIPLPLGAHSIGSINDVENLHPIGYLSTNSSKKNSKSSSGRVIPRPLVDNVSDAPPQIPTDQNSGLLPNSILNPRPLKYSGPIQIQNPQSDTINPNPSSLNIPNKHSVESNSRPILPIQPHPISSTSIQSIDQRANKGNTFMYQHQPITSKQIGSTQKPKNYQPYSRKSKK
ncbi:hypothetical protein AYI68_g843 [Smittium mucronatum]|uniref:Nuclear receptor corepressor 1 n=1 Tax=Smittium mucronatum TaxID=133383 RepID=A0A1R0H792_9FUNG|nr:hypothetical protein AYI68_g843 [Smittium mucronatum]